MGRLVPVLQALQDPILQWRYRDAIAATRAF
jgi:hypothetical protein